MITRGKMQKKYIKTSVIELLIPFFPLVSKIWIININLVYKFDFDIVLNTRVSNVCLSLSSSPILLSLSLQLYHKIS